MARNVLKYIIQAQDKSKSATDSAKSNMDDMGGAARRTGEMLKAAFTATAIIAGIRMIASEVSKSIEAFGRYEGTVQRLDAVMRATGHAAGFTTRQLENMATTLSRETNNTGLEIMEMQSILGTFVQITGDEFERTMSVAVDLSEVFGQDLKGSAIQLGKALEDPTNGMTALSRVGVSFSEEQKALVRQMQAVGDIAGAQGVVLGVLESQVGGVGRAMKNTTEGSMKAFADAWTDLRANMGEAAAQRMQPIRDFFTGLITEMNDAASAARGLRQALAEVAGNLETGGDLSAVGNIDAYIESLVTVLEDDRQAVERIRNQIANMSRGATFNPNAAQDRRVLEQQLSMRENRIAEVLIQIE